MKRIIAFALALTMALSLVACGGSSSSSSSEPASSSEPEVVEEVVEEEPEEEEYVFDGAPLTGLAKDDSFEASRWIAIMINNRSDCRPQRGLSSADVLFEIMVEGGITRFCALFPNVDSVPVVGPVRSGRDQFFRLIRPYQALYFFVGRSEITQQYIDDEDYGDLAVNGMKVGFAYRLNRGEGYPTDATAYTDSEQIQKVIDDRDIDMTRNSNSPIFDFISYEDEPLTPADGSATSVNIVHSSSYRTAFTYDEASGTYLTSLYAPKSGYTAMIDEANGQRIAFENVIVLFTEITQYPYPGGNEHGNPDYKKVDYDYGGLGYYISNGGIQEIRWTKGGTINALMLTDMDGNSLKVNCGKSYVAVVSLDEYDNFSWEGDGSDATENEIDVSEADDSAAAEAEAAADAADEAA